MSDLPALARRDTRGSLASTDTGAGGLSLPPDLLAQTAIRLQIITAACLGMLLLARLIYGRGIEGEREELMTGFRSSLYVVGMVVSVLTFFVARLACRTSEQLQRAGAVFYLFVAYLISFMNHTVPLEFADPVYGNLPMHGVSWVAIWTFMYFTVVPSPPRLILLAGIVGVSADPLLTYGLEAWSKADPSLFQRLMGYTEQPHPGWRNVVSFYSFSYAIAIIAVLPAKILQRLVHQIRRAKRMGSYQLVSRLGRGGMGEVWLARHRMLARPAAIKLIRPELLGSASPDAAEATLRRFEREAQATAALRSPHSIQLYDFGRTEDGTFYYVMELLDGLTLEQLVLSHGPLPAARVIHVLRQACHSLADAHARDLVHRDVKPANIFVCRMGQDVDFVKVLDFGLVRSHGDHSAVTATSTSQDVATGTPAFMAPETALGSAEPDGRVDVYALGCVAYWLLTGELVFEADNPVQMAVRHVKDDVIPPSRRTEITVPESLEKLVMSCLEKDPLARPQTVDELGRGLAALAAEHPWAQSQARQWWERHHPETEISLGPSEEEPTSGDDIHATRIVKHLSTR